jgi:methylation protein EvaC
MGAIVMSLSGTCRVCAGSVREFFDFGRQPLSDAFVEPGDTREEFFFRLAVGRCDACTMVQLMEEVPRERMFHDGYPYLSSGSAVMRAHFEAVAERFLATELTGPDPFIVEVGCNDGVMLETIAKAGVRHLGVEPSGGTADLAAAKGVQVRKVFFEHATALEVLRDHGHADVVYMANTFCHIPYVESIFAGVSALLTDNGVFVFEDPYLGDIVRRTSFDQIYDEHFYYFSGLSVQRMAQRFGFDLVDVEPLPTHGGEIRYTLARSGARTPTPAVAELLDRERETGLSEPGTLTRFAGDVARVRDELIGLLRDLRDRGKRVVGYGATAKSATVTNFCGIGPDLVEFVSDTSPTKQGRLTPGAHLPVRPPEAFADPYPDYALLFAWNHAEEIMAKERAFREAGGKWILYVPEVRVL